FRPPTFVRAADVAPPDSRASSTVPTSGLLEGPDGAVGRTGLRTQRERVGAALVRTLAEDRRHVDRVAGLGRTRAEEVAALLVVEDPRLHRTGQVDRDGQRTPVDGAGRLPGAGGVGGRRGP